MNALNLPSHSIKGILLSCILFIPVFLSATGSWPKEIQTTKSNILIYQPEPDSMSGDHLYSRAAISFTSTKYPAPVYGAIWMDSRFSTDREAGTCNIFDVKILNVRFPGVDTIDPSKVSYFKQILSEQATSWNLEYSINELTSTLTSTRAAVRSSSGINNDPPEIIFTKHNSMLLIFDGDPVFKETGIPGINRAINTPFLVLQDLTNNSFYLNGGDYWYITTDPVRAYWKNIPNPPANIAMYFDELKKQVDYSGGASQNASPNQSTGNLTGIPEIIVRTRPCELIQSNGEPQWAPIQGTQLLYLTNTDDNIFMTIEQNQFYMLISGRWYWSYALTGPWSYIDSDKLPPDFTRIPVGSVKDIVLASVAGTDAAKDAVMDAQIPQTAAVDRKTAQCIVEYDGDPKFEKIHGTDIARAVNTSSTVLLFQDIFYVCDNAVWFTGPTPNGPWEVATSVPDEFQSIPPDDPAYNVKYVYIYDVEPDVVYIGYTPGYTGCYIYGSTIVYGTGWIYSPFYGSYYYPRPYTYGFHMHYNPWYGWCMGFSMSRGWFRYSFGERMHRHGGWWGPPSYRPPYHPRFDHYYGPRRPVYQGGNTIIANNNRTNIYNKRTDGSAKPVRQAANPPQPGAVGHTGNQHPNDRTKPGVTQGTNEIKPAGRAAGTKNNVFTDKNGDIYKNNNGEWQKTNGKTWTTVQPKEQKVKPAEQSKEQGRTEQTQPKPQQIKPAEQSKEQGRTEQTQPKPQQIKPAEQTQPKPQQIKPAEQTNQQVKTEQTQTRVQQVKPAEQPRQQERVSPQPVQQVKSSSFNRQELENQNSARERGAQNLNNRTSAQQSQPSGAGGSKGNSNEGRKK
jgi:hypothetical protein